MRSVPHAAVMVTSAERARDTDPACPRYRAYTGTAIAATATAAGTAKPSAARTRPPRHGMGRAHAMTARPGSPTVTRPRSELPRGENGNGSPAKVAARTIRSM